MKKGKKLEAEEIQSLSAAKEVAGIFEGTVMINENFVDRRSGQVKALEAVKIGGKLYWLDGGLRGTLKMLRLQVGKAYFFTHTGTEMYQGNEVNTYEICEAV